MNRKINKRWVFTLLASAGLIGLALAGGSWSKSSAETLPGTIPAIISMTPTYYELNAQKAILSITCSVCNFKAYQNGVYTQVRLTQQYTSTPFIEYYTPYELTETSIQVGSGIKGILPEGLSPNIVGNPSLWKVEVVVKQSGATIPVVEISLPSYLVIDHVSLYMPIVVR